MGTWRLEDLPADRKPVGCQWVYDRKRNEHGEVIKYKARLVAQGFSQKPGTDYNNDGTFAPVMRFETLRTLLAFSAVHNLKLRQFDVKSAYLHGRPNLLLGIKISQGNHIVTLSQTHYIDALLEKFGLADANPVFTPMDVKVKLDNVMEEQDNEGQGEKNDKVTHRYAALIGSLMYLAIGTRPDIAFAVNKLEQFMQNPRPIHWTAVKRVFRYLKYTRTNKLTYGGDDDLLNTDFNIFCDANWASDASDRKSISGYVITMAGGAVSWSSKKQTSVALSTAEAEYVAATHVAKQVLWQRSLFTELDFDIPTTSTIFTDNQAAISISHHPEFHSRTKHINIAYHFLRDLIAEGILNTIYVNMRENLADLFTKGLPRELHEDMTYRIGSLSG